MESGSSGIKSAIKSKGPATYPRPRLVDTNVDSPHKKALKAKSGTSEPQWTKCIVTMNGVVLVLS